MPECGNPCGMLSGGLVGRMDVHHCIRQSGAASPLMVHTTAPANSNRLTQDGICAVRAGCQCAPDLYP